MMGPAANPGVFLRKVERKSWCCCRAGARAAGAAGATEHRGGLGGLGRFQACDRRWVISLLG